jgi:hypothetical protein
MKKFITMFLKDNWSTMLLAFLVIALPAYYAWRQEYYFGEDEEFIWYYVYVVSFFIILAFIVMFIRSWVDFKRGVYGK